MSDETDESIICGNCNSEDTKIIIEPFEAIQKWKNRANLRIKVVGYECLNCGRSYNRSTVLEKLDNQS